MHRHELKRIDIVYAICHMYAVVKHSPINADRHLAGMAFAGHPPASDTKGSINLRIDSRTRDLIDEAAVALGKTRTEFMIDSARALAIDVLLDQRLFVLDSQRYEAFVHALDNPPSPGPKLRALLRRSSAWQS